MLAPARNRLTAQASGRRGREHLKETKNEESATDFVGLSRSREFRLRCR